MLRLDELALGRARRAGPGVPFDRAAQPVIVAQVEASIARVNRAADDEAFATAFRIGSGARSLAERLAFAEVWVGFVPDGAHALVTSRAEPHAVALSGSFFGAQNRDPLLLDAIVLHGVQHGLDGLGLRRGADAELEAEEVRRIARKNRHDLRRVFRDLVRPLCAACCGARHARSRAG